MCLVLSPRMINENDVGWMLVKTSLLCVMYFDAPKSMNQTLDNDAHVEGNKILYTLSSTLATFASNLGNLVLG